MSQHKRLEVHLNLAKSLLLAFQRPQVLAVALDDGDEVVTAGPAQLLLQSPELCVYRLLTVLFNWLELVGLGVSKSVRSAVDEPVLLPLLEHVGELLVESSFWYWYDGLSPDT